MHRIFQAFIDHLAESSDVETLRAGMADAAAALDLNCFAYLSMPAQTGSEPQVISTYPASWTAHYLRNHYERLDPVIAEALQTAQPFRWGVDFPSKFSSMAQQRLFDEASQFGIRFGFTVPIHDGRGPIAAMTFAVDHRRPQFETC